MSQSKSGIQNSDIQELAGLNFLFDIQSSPDNIIDWAESNASKIDEILHQNGALLIRGLKIQGSKKLEKVLTAAFGEELLEYIYRSTPRTKMRGRVYTSSEYHADESILLHNENAYSNRWPLRIAFYCVKAAAMGGATPIADSRSVYQNIPVEIRQEFERRKLLYVRNYSELDLPWIEVFQTNDKQKVEQYCQQNGVEFEWLPENKLRTKQMNDATSIHPFTQQKVWFNQAHLFHISSQSDEIRKSLLNIVGLDGLPRNVYYGDGGEIDEQTIAIIRQAYEENTVIFDWQEGDLLLLDNMLFAHGRKPFKGSRRILTGMSRSVDFQINKIKKMEEEVN